MQARVGEGEGAGVEDGVAMEQEVEVEDARAVARFGGAVASEVAFDAEEMIEEGGGLERGFDGEGGIDVVILVGRAADGAGFAEGGELEEACGGEMCDAIDGGAECELALAEIGAEGDVGGRSHGEILRAGGKCARAGE